MSIKRVTAYPVSMPTDKRFSYLGSCTCGNVSIELLLTESLTNYVPRACDCKFCTAHKIAYLSDPHGQLNVTSLTPLNAVKQGSNQATFWFCSMCADMVCVNRFADKLKGAVNVSTLDDQSLLAQALVVSPKQLSPQQKMTRWNKAWMPVVMGENSRLR